LAVVLSAVVDHAALAQVPSVLVPVAMQVLVLVAATLATGIESVANADKVVPLAVVVVALAVQGHWGCLLKGHGTLQPGNPYRSCRNVATVNSVFCRVGLPCNALLSSMSLLTYVLTTHLANRHTHKGWGDSQSKGIVI